MPASQTRPPCAGPRKSLVTSLKFFFVPAKMNSSPQEGIGVKSTVECTALSVLGHSAPVYHRRRDCCSAAGDTEGEGLAMVMPVAGLMMGMALRPRVAEG